MGHHLEISRARRRPQLNTAVATQPVRDRGIGNAIPLRPAEKLLK